MGILFKESGSFKMIYFLKVLSKIIFLKEKVIGSILMKTIPIVFMFRKS